MKNNIRIATFADAHLGVTTYGTIDPVTGLNTRVLNALNSLDEMIVYCINNDIKYIICAGDIYKNSLPSPTLQDEFNKRLYNAAKHGISIYLMDGNHDVSIMPQNKSSLKSFKTFEVPNIYHTRFKKSYYIEENGLRIKLLFLPTYCDADEIDKILNEETIENIPTIVIGHITVRGAHLNDWLIESKEKYVDIPILQKPNIIAVVLGHLHKHQILSQNPLIYYTGSLQRIDFNEEHQEKGFVVLDINDKNVNYDFIKIESQKFLTMDMNVKNIENETDFIIDQLNNNSFNIKNSIIRLRVEMKKESVINDKGIYNHLKSLGATHIMNIQKKIDRDNSIRNEEITGDISTLQTLELYFKNSKNGNKRIAKGKEILEKLEKENKL